MELYNGITRAQFGASIGSWWNQVCSGDAYTIGQTTEVGSASKADSLLGKAVKDFGKLVKDAGEDL